MVIHNQLGSWAESRLQIYFGQCSIITFLLQRRARTVCAVFTLLQINTISYKMLGSFWAYIESVHETSFRERGRHPVLAGV